MARVTVRTAKQAEPIAEGVLDYFGEASPLGLQRQAVEARATLKLPASANERMIYVHTGETTAGETALCAGSALILEGGAQVSLVGGAEKSLLLIFVGVDSSEHRNGGHVHMLPQDRVPRIARMGVSGVSGAIFADGSCPTCQVWLHENRFPPQSQPPADRQAGVHSHDEDEIIFVTGGSMLLGNRAVGPGTAIAIAAGTLYSFLPGPEGLTFVNFRAHRPGLIHFADGRTADEVAVWGATDRPLEYIDA